MAISTTPPTIRNLHAWSRTARARWVNSLPATATTNSGTAAPAANAAVRNTAVQPTRWVAPTTVMAASIGPAQGTNKRPQARPMTRPAAVPLGWRPPNLAKGRSNSSPRGGIKKPRPTATSTAIPASWRKSWGRRSADRTSEPARIKKLKLITRPPTTATGRRRAPRVGRPSDRRPAPATSTTGRTGRMHGEIPATIPATKPTTISSATGPHHIRLISLRTSPGCGGFDHRRARARAERPLQALYGGKPSRRKAPSRQSMAARSPCSRDTAPNSPARRRSREVNWCHCHAPSRWVRMPISS